MTPKRAAARQPGGAANAAPRPTPAPVPHRWLLLVHQLPATPSNLRVRTWRRLQQLGAVAVKQAVHALPDSAAAREDFEWLKAEIEAAGGQASVFVADTVDTWSNDALIDEFRRLRQEAYDELTRDATHVLKAFSRNAKRRRPQRALRQFKERLAAIERVDFFGSAGRDRAALVLRQLEEQSALPRIAAPVGGASLGSDAYRGRLWVTRPRPGVDRMATAWLIRRFIDADARFGFVSDRGATPPDAIPFDMFGVQFTHRGDLCTFEMMCETFQLDEPALRSIARVVHDLDLKDGRFGAPEAAAVGLVIEGLRLTYADDDVLLREGVVLFEALYRALEQADRVAGPRPVVSLQRKRRTRRPRARGR